MPYKSEKIRIAGTQYDRRIKLTPDQKEYIKWLREKQLISYSKLAKIFGVSKRLIQFICCPDKYLKNKESLKQRKAEGRYKHTKAEWARGAAANRAKNETITRFIKWSSKFLCEDSANIRTYNLLWLFRPIFGVKQNKK